jgi:all-trans-retinol 13,14-reductase
MWNAIVIGSGIGGLAAAAALARRGRRVLVLEQHAVAGGQTQVFDRPPWRFATGVHYLGGVGPQPGPEGQFGRLLAWLSGGALQFEACANPYDIVRLPGLHFGIPHPEAAYREALHEAFPQAGDDIERWFEHAAAARRSAMTLMALHSMPPWMAWALRLLRGAEAAHWAGHTVADELRPIRDPGLRAVLGARWGDYGAPPARAPFVEHALVTGSYDGGAWYPRGGPAQFVATLKPVIEAAGGELRVGADAVRILGEGAVSGVEVDCGGQRRIEVAPVVISAMGLGNTVARLSPTAAAPWHATADHLRPGLAFVALYLGLEGDIAAAGVNSANHWIYGSEDIGRLWRDPAGEDAPNLFVSFPSLKDPSSALAPTVEVLSLLDTDAFAPWLAAPDGPRDEDYLAYKDWIGDRLLTQFKRHFPALAPMVRHVEVATPLTQRRYTRTPEGSMYGLEMTAERLQSPALNLRTPLPGLLLAGQDVSGPGVQAACMSGLLAAATVEPALWREFGR